MRGKSKISVCLLTYNRAEKLKKTLDSLLSQTYADFDLLICDDSSDDKTQEICLDYTQRDSRIVYHRNQHNIGMPGNLNKGLSLCDGEYLANLHDGDIYREDLLDQWKFALDTYPSAGFVFNAYQAKDGDGKDIVYKESYPSFIPGYVIGKRLLSRWNSCVFGTVMARRSVYERLGWFDQKFGNYSDVDMWLRIARVFDVAYIKEPLIKLMPIDTTRFYSFIHWKVSFWLMGIHVSNLLRYQSCIPEYVKELSVLYPRRRRKMLFYNLMICVKYKRWDKVLEAFAIWKDSDDPILRILGSTIGIHKYLPNWYDPSYWDMAKLKIRFDN
jgi:glycosyltransferase involved in cell wall biosynthesis